MDELTSLPDLVSVLSTASEGETAIVRGLLEAEGIAVVESSMTSKTYGGAFESYEGRYADILVSAQDAERARALLAAAQSVPEETTT